jgi:hypothetical protein
MANMTPYSGRTWVSFIDISGFKNEMGKGTDYARNMLNKFYSSVYYSSILYRKRNPDWNTIELNVISVSDCAIAFTRNNSRYEQDFDKGLITMLLFIKDLNRKLIKNPEPRILTKSSICYGDFNFENRDEHEGNTKDFFYGDGYLKAYMDNSSTSNKLEPGECRIIMDDRVIPDLEDTVLELTKIKENNFYFYWMLNHKQDINKFLSQYNIDVFEIKKDIINAYLN